MTALKHAARFSLGALALMAFGGAARAAGPSFDCAKASAPVEKLLCADANLGTLDTKLAAALKAALARPGQDRDATLAAQRRWLAARDKTCVVPDQLDKDKRAPLIECLASAYRRQINVLSYPETPGGICLKIVDRLRGLVDAGSRDAKAKASPGDSLLDFFTQTPASGISVVKPVFETSSYGDGPSLKKRLAQLKPAFTLAPDLAKALDDVSGEISLYQLPGASLRALNSIDGTAHCNSTVFFDVAGGRARLVADPASFEDGGPECGELRAFGSVDGQPAIIEDGSDYTPNLSAGLFITRRAPDGWAPMCQIEFHFAPKFTPGVTENDWVEAADACKGADCDELEQAAARLAEATQKEGLGIEARALGALSPAQREAFAALKKRADAPAPSDDPDSKPTGPDDYTDQHPILLPLVVKDRVYLATVGHPTIGWRLFADWKVDVQTAEGDKLKSLGQFAIGMGRGRLLGADVQ